jgi:fructose-bisphosphate aldolase class I
LFVVFPSALMIFIVFILFYQNTPEEIADHTIHSLENTVPCSVPGVMFLSGGLSEANATTYLNAINSRPRLGPWRMSFSFGRALQRSCLSAWNGLDENIEIAQIALLQRAKACSQASMGSYS